MLVFRQIQLLYFYLFYRYFFGDQPANKHPTYYFRTSINIEDPNEFSYFTFNLHVDDAAIVYVNGNEIIRDGFRDDEIVNYNTYAPSNGKEGVFDTFEVEASAFSSGENIRLRALLMKKHVMRGSAQEALLLLLR